MKSKPKCHSVVIVGGGPAGCATALSLRTISIALELNLQITLCNAPVNSGPAIGETVPPILSQYLREINVEHVLDERNHLPCPGSISVWQNDVPGYNDFLFTPVGRGFHLNRNTFNQQLLHTCITHGVHVLSNSRVCNMNKERSGYRLLINHEKSLVNMHCDFVVDATGYSRTIVNKLNIAQNTLDKVMSLCAFFALKGAKAKAAHTIVCSAENGWWYGTQLPQNKALISFCTDTQEIKSKQMSSPKNWFKHFRDSEWFHKQCITQFGTEVSLPDNLCIRPCKSDILSNVIGPNWLAVGDAASSYDSISSAGITKSVIHGICAGKSIGMAVCEQSQQPLFEYQQRVFDDFRHYVTQHQSQYAAGGARFNYSGFWRRRNIFSLMDDVDKRAINTE